MYHPELSKSFLYLALLELESIDKATGLHPNIPIFESMFNTYFR